MTDECGIALHGTSGGRAISTSYSHNSSHARFVIRGCNDLREDVDGIPVSVLIAQHTRSNLQAKKRRRQEKSRDCVGLMILQSLEGCVSPPVSDADWKKSHCTHHFPDRLKNSGSNPHRNSELSDRIQIVVSTNRNRKTAQLSQIFVCEILP